MLIFRYLAKEVFITLASLTAILMLIFMSNQFVHYLNRAASGQIPAIFIVKLMMLEMPNLMGLLLPLGFYMSLMIAYGRLYAESEMTVLNACGYGPNQLLKHSMMMALVVAAIVTLIVLWGGPIIAVERAKLIRTSGVQTLIQTIVPGRFNSVSGGRKVFYVESISRDHTKAQHVFLAQLSEKKGKRQWDVLWAEKAFSQTDKDTLESYVVLENGRDYQGTPGHADYQVAYFDRFKARLPHPVVAIKNDVRTEPTSELWPINKDNLPNAAEMQWRLSVPLMVITLTLVGVPLSRVNPRTGKFAKLLPAIVLYIFYANFMFVTRDWIKAGKIPVWLGMWWLHIVVALIGILLIWRQRVKFS